MALPHLTDEQTQTWTREQKDRWWLENVFRGNMPQLTLRAALTGFLLGGILSATNLYIGAKTGWTLGVGVTSVILSFVIFRALARTQISKDMTILENNAVQSIATAAGYMTGPMISALMAYMFVTNETMEWHKMLIWNIVASILGVLVAFPLKRRFINDEQQPFHEGRACAVVLDSLYPAAPQGGTKNMVDGTPVAKAGAQADGGVGSGLFKAKALAWAAAIGAGLQLIVATGYMAFLQVKTGMVKATDGMWKVPDHLEDWYYALAAKSTWLWTPAINGVKLNQLGFTLAFDLSMIGAGGLMGMRIANSVLIGMVANFLFVAPLMVGAGEIMPRNIAEIANPDGTYLYGDAIFGRAHLTNTWCLWWGVSMMVTASMVGLFAKPKMLISAFTGLFAKKSQNEDCLRHVELPLKWSFIGIPIVSAVIIYINHEWFGVDWWIGALSIPLIIVLTLIAANATALTGTTPTGSLSKITQFSFGALQPANPATNLMTAGVTTEVAGNASNLLMDIKPGYMLDAKPRQQAIGHCIGIVAGALASTPLFYLLFLWTRKPDVAIEQHITESWAVPGAVQWAAISKVIGGMGEGGQTVQVGADGISKMWGVLPVSAAWAMLAGAALAFLFEVWRVRSKGKFPLSAVGIGLGVVLPPESTVMMWTGAALFTFFERKYHHAVGSFAWKLWVDSKEAVCAGLIAGWAIFGIGDGIIAAVATFPGSTEAVEAREKDIESLRADFSANPSDLALATNLGVALAIEPLSGAHAREGRELLDKAAAGGRGDAMHALAQIAEAEGKPVAEVAALYRTASDAGSAKAAIALATMLDGPNAPTLEGTDAWLEAQAASGSPIAARVLATRMMASGGSAARATELYRSAAQEGDAQAAWKMCTLAAQTGATAKDVAAWWLVAAEGGVREVGTMLDAVAATVLSDGSDVQRMRMAAVLVNGKAGRIDIGLSRKVLEASAATSVEAAFMLALNLMDRSPTDEGGAAKLLGPLAAAGDARAEVALGDLLARVDDQPIERAEVLGALGIAEGASAGKAQELWTAAASRGSVRAMFNLGWQHEAGWGVARDDAKAREWWLKAAELGDARSMYRYGRSLADSAAGNLETTKDAAFWLMLAKSKRAAGAEYAASRACAHLDEATVEAIGERVKEWTPAQK
ncbi:MAG: OPT/YSL family transporter [Planctomycetota bacterium]